MKFAKLIAITALVIYIVSAVLNQFGYIWTDWGSHVQSTWEFCLIFGSFHYYRKSKYKVWYFDIIGLSLIGFASINLFHALRCVGFFMYTDRSMQEINLMAFDVYNCFILLMASIPVIIAATVYLINLPYILHKK